MRFRIRSAAALLAGMPADELPCSMFMLFGPALQYVFMDLSTYEETRLPKDDTWAKWLKVGFAACTVQLPYADTIDTTSCQHLATLVEGFQHIAHAHSLRSSSQDAVNQNALKGSTITNLASEDMWHSPSASD